MLTQIQNRSLGHTFAERVREFEWQPGSLTRAVKSGKWVLIEGVDVAPFEILSALVPLLEERKLYIAGRGETVVAHPQFQLFGSAR